MAQLFFKYGAMNSSKTASLLMVKHNYEEQGKHTLLFTSSLDDRDGVGKVSSRIGIESKATSIKPTDNIFKLYHDEISKYLDNVAAIGLLTSNSKTKSIQPDCILVDEAQFLTEQQVIQFARIVDNYDIPVVCYGLKNDFRNQLFEGSRALLTYADKIEEIKTICWDCKKKAIMNARLVNGKIVTSGDQVDIGGNDKYLSLCRKCYFARKEGVTEEC